MKNKFQQLDEQKLLTPFAEDFVGYEEPHDIYTEVLQPGWPYLPADGALGEMALSVGYPTIDRRSTPNDTPGNMLNVSRARSDRTGR